MKKILKVVHNLFIAESQNSIFLLYVYFVMFGLLELISIGSLFLISAVLFSFESELMTQLRESFGLSEIRLAFVALILLILCYCFRVFQLKLIRKQLSEVGSRISYKLYAAYLKNEFSYYLNIDSSSMVSAIAYKMNGVMFGGLFPYLRLITALSSLIFVLISSIYIFGFWSLVYIISLALLCCCLIYLLRKKTGNISITSAIVQDKTVKNIQESFTNIKEIKVNALSDYYNQLYFTDDKKLRQLQADGQYISALGPVMLEILLLIPTLGVGLILLSSQLYDFVIRVELLAIAFVLLMRAMPYLLQTLNCFTVLMTNKSLILQVYEYYKRYEKSIDQSPKIQMLPGGSFTFENVSYSHDGKIAVLEDLNFVLCFDGITVIQGPTGSGKSTLLDLILGLLQPSKGKIYFNNEKINVRSDGETVFTGVGYLTQQAIMPNITIREFFQLSLVISEEKIKNLLKTVEMFEIIQSRDGLDTLIGEQGYRFSGGQRQRLRLAKLLATKQSLIIIDEALNAVPLDMEARILKRINKEFEVNIVYVSHRENLIMKVDQVIRVIDEKVQVHHE